MKEELKDFDFAWEEEMIDDVLRHLKTFEKYYSYYQRLRELVDNPNDYIVGDNSLTSIQKLNNELYKLETMSILNNPKTSADRANRDQIMSLINGLIDRGEFSRNDIDKALEGLKLINKPSYQTIEQILKQFCRMTYNKKTKTYSVKENW